MRGREEVRLSAIFERILTLSLALPVGATACSKSSSSSRPDAGVSADPCAPVLERVVWAYADGGGECRAFQRFSCGLPATAKPIDGGCAFHIGECQKLCPSFGAFACRAMEGGCPSATLSTAGPVTIACDFCPGNIGRRPTGLAREAGSPDRAGDPVGAYLARAEHLEAASVRAFRDLVTSLRAHGAPPELVRDARVAARDEVRHARVVGRLARARGGRLRRVHVARRERPSLEMLAAENAVEGCVRETYGALVASFQARHAEDPELAAALGEIARDETRHAALAWRIFEWLSLRLSDGARARVGRVVSVAVRELEGEAEPLDADVVRRAGLPPLVEQRRLIAGLRERLWQRITA